MLLTPPGTHVLDVRLWYTPDDAFALLDSLGVEGRAAYAKHAVADLVFIAIYTYLLRAAAPGRLRALAWIPGLLDAMETAGILVLLSVFPSRPVTLATAVAIATPLKWAAGGLLVTAIVVMRFAARAARRSG